MHPGGARTIAHAAAILGLLGTSAGCRTQCLADEKATPEQLQREQKAVLRGQGTCRELLVPKLRVVDDRVVLEAVRENVLAKRADLPTTEVTTFAPLFERLRGYRTHFRAVRTAESFEPTIYVTLDPALESVRAATLLTTAASAGYDRSRIYAGDVVVDVLWSRPRPESPTESVLCMASVADGSLSVRLRGGRASSPVRVDALAAEITRACGAREPCAELVVLSEREDARFVATARALGAVLGAAPFASRRPRVKIVTRVAADVPSPCEP